MSATGKPSAAGRQPDGRLPGFPVPGRRPGHPVIGPITGRFTGVVAGGSHHADPNNRSIVLLLSLFLLLLVFFIVLNAQSVQTVHKVKAVAASLERTFPSFAIDPRLRDGTDPVASRSGTVFAVERLEDVGTLFAAVVAVAKVETVSPGRLLEVRLPADDLFVAGTATVRPDRQGLLDRTVTALRESRQGERLELDALLAIGPTGTPSQPPGPVARAAALARALIEDGAPAEAVTVGIERGDPGSARLLFSLRLAGEPAGRRPAVGRPSRPASRGDR